MNHDNAYQDVLEDWKVELIRTRAKRLGFRRHDLEDAQQEIVLDVLEFCFDAAKSNGACERTALTSLIDRRLMTILRTKRRYAQHVCSPVDDSLQDEPFSEPVPQQQLVMDVRAVITDLSADEQLVCQALVDGESVNQIARRLGCSWRAVNNTIAHIRQFFESVGLDGRTCG